MQANIWIDEMDQNVTFTARKVRTNSLMAKYPDYYLKEVTWENEKYTPEENTIIVNYYTQAVGEFFDAIKEINENYF